MKKLSIYVIALATTISTVFANGENEKSLTVNKKVSKVEWVGKKVTGQHNGTLAVAKGEVFLNGTTVTRGTILLDMNSIVCLDLDGEYNEKLVGHLKSDDFFSVANYPTVTFNFSKVEEIKEKTSTATHLLIGELTIKGITHPVTAPAEVVVRGNSLVAIGEVKIDRTLFDIKYGSSNFFEGLGDKAIDNDFIVNFRIGAK
jgi:polyisoprenoid-binding protein YceI